MKKRIVWISILYGGILSTTHAQNCNCSLLLENTKGEVQQYYKSKTLPKGELAAVKLYDKLKIFVNQPHTEEDCQELIKDYLDMFEDDSMKQQFEQLKNKH